MKFNIVQDDLYASQPEEYHIFRRSTPRSQTSFCIHGIEVFRKVSMDSLARRLEKDRGQDKGPHSSNEGGSMNREMKSESKGKKKDTANHINPGEFSEFMHSNKVTTDLERRRIELYKQNHLTVLAHGNPTCREVEKRKSTARINVDMCE